MKHFLIVLALIVGASSIFAPSTAEASCSGKCDKALEKAIDVCGKARTPRVLQGCMTHAQQTFYACQRKCARGTSTELVESGTCSGCRCKTECWKNGQCRSVCRDSCGRFCFTSPQAAAVEMSRGKKVDSYVEEQVTKVKQRCADKWDSNYRMQKYCRKRQVEGFTWVNTFIIKHKLGTKPYPTKTVPFKVMTRCWAKWTDRYGQDWPMVAYCVKRDMAAYRSL